MEGAAAAAAHVRRRMGPLMERRLDAAMLAKAAEVRAKCEQLARPTRRPAPWTSCGCAMLNGRLRLPHAGARCGDADVASRSRNSYANVLDVARVCRARTRGGGSAGRAPREARRPCHACVRAGFRRRLLGSFLWMSSASTVARAASSWFGHDASRLCHSSRAQSPSRHTRQIRNKVSRPASRLVLVARHAVIPQLQ